MFCPNCNNILDISKNVPKANTILGTSTPTSVSSDAPKKDDSQNLIKNILKNIVDGNELSNQDLKSIDIDKIIHDEEYKKMDKANKKKIDDILSSIHTNLDSATGAYYVCRTCFYSKAIETKTLITSRACEGLSSGYVNTEKFKNMVYNKALPLTRAYICTNKDCKSHKNHDKREAVFFRDGMQVWYACKSCQSYWKGE